MYMNLGNVGVVLHKVPTVVSHNNKKAISQLSWLRYYHKEFEYGNNAVQVRKYLKNGARNLNWPKGTCMIND